ncbi:sugar isomerase [Actinomycetes bacterium KLBMP 9759]
MAPDAGAAGSRITFREGQAAQPEALERVAAHVRGALAGADLDPLLTARHPLLTGIGASFAALAVPVELLRQHGVATHRVLADEIARVTWGFDADVLVGVSQSGRSTETLAAFEQVEVPTLAVVNVAPSALTQLAGQSLDLGNEPDSFASTVGFTGTVVALDLLAGAVTGAGAAHWDGIGERVVDMGERVAGVVARLGGRAAECVAADAVASGASLASAEATALLLREVARVPASASATHNHLHGEMESAGGTLHLVFGDGRETELARTLSGAGHLTVLFTTRPVVPGPDLAVVAVPDVAPAVRVVLEVVAVQELVAAIADERGIAIESFVFANNDTKLGGVDPRDFEVVPHG